MGKQLMNIIILATMSKHCKTRVLIRLMVVIWPGDQEVHKWRYDIGIGPEARTKSSEQLSAREGIGDGVSVSSSS